MEITLPYLHPTQQMVVESQARFRVLACGRRWGKTLLSSVLSVVDAIEGKRVGWIAPSYRQALEGWKLGRHLAIELGATIREGDREILFPSGGTIEARTADDPDSLRGAGWDLVILDECREIHSRAWSEVIRPALMDRSGRAVFISTPNGWDWFYELYLLGQRGADGWESWNFPSHDNPWIPRAELDKAEKEEPERVWKQEYRAEFLPDGAGIFRFVREASTRAPEAGNPHYRYVTFFDTALGGANRDYNAISVFRMDGNRPVQVYADRWGELPFAAQQARLSRLRQYPGKVLTDITGTNWYRHPGVIFIGGLVGPALSVTGVNINAGKKEAWTRALSIGLENSEVGLLDPKKCKEEAMKKAVEAQIVELEHWREHRTEAGNKQLKAPKGENDDMAVAVMASYTACKEGLGSDGRNVWNALGGFGL